LLFSVLPGDIACFPAAREEFMGLFLFVKAEGNSGINYPVMI